MMTSLGIDPADILALHLLLSERHVTRAAKMLGVTQSTMSHRLAKLRGDLNDDLLVPDGNELLRTARAEAMLGPLTEALAALQKALVSPSPFVPHLAQFTVTIVLPDILSLLLPRLRACLHAEAPSLQLNVRGLPRNLSEVMREDERTLVVAPEQFASPTTQVKRIGLLKFGVFFRDQHPLSTGRLTLKRWLSHAHVVVSIQNSQSNLISTELEKRGLTRQIGLVVPGFLAGLLVVADSDLLMNAPVLMARELTIRLGLVTRPLPLPVDPVQLSLLWHGKYQADPAHSWLRSRVHAFLQAELGARATAAH